MATAVVNNADQSAVVGLPSPHSARTASGMTLTIVGATVTGQIIVDLVVNGSLLLICCIPSGQTTNTCASSGTEPADSVIALKVICQSRAGCSWRTCPG